MISRNKKNKRDLKKSVRRKKNAKPNKKKLRKRKQKSQLRS